MAKFGNFLSLWDDDEGDEPHKAKKPRGPRPNPKYADDELTSDEYGGYNSNENSGSYRFNDAFDDSNEHWYQKNSFRYGKHADYSPSSLFRSAFSRSYSHGGNDNEAKNKAIRALRNLTRSANTIVDKTAGSKQFSVQFSSGADSNGTLEKLNDDKQRVVFVSPDTLLAATTTEDEDSAVDALTGFILLRVQMSQDVAVDVIKRINYTGAHTAGIKIAAQFVKPGAKALADSTPEELRTLSRTAVDEHLAGMLAKSVLMRLARRKVVMNWGGFAPYFIRHAKKFAAVKEHLETAELSVESVVSKLGYNMLADEEPITVDKVFEDIAAKHLGEEVPMAELLATCHRLVEDIRAAMVSVSEAVPGDMEEALNEMLEKAQEEQKAAESGSDPLTDFLSKFGNSMIDTVDETNAQSTEQYHADVASGELSDTLRKANSIEQLLKKLADTIDKMSETIENTTSADPAEAEHAQYQLLNTRNSLNYLLKSRPQGLVELSANGLKPAIDEIFAACQSSKTTVTEAEAKALQEQVQQVIEKATKFTKKNREETKKRTNDLLTLMKERLERVSAAAESRAASVTSTREELEKVSGVDVDAKASALYLLSETAATLNRFVERAAELKLTIDKDATTASTARSTTTLEKTHKSARQTMANAMSAFNAISLTDHRAWSTTAIIQKMLQTLNKLRGTMPNAEAVDLAVKEAVSTKRMSPESFAAAMARGAAGSAHKFIDDKPEDDDGGDDDDSDLSVNKATRLRIQELLDDLSDNGLNTSAAIALGETAAAKLQEIQDKSSPVDGELFGKKIEVTTKILDGDSIGRVNDEARNDPEEEYIAYLSNEDEAKPKVRTAKEGSASYRGGRANVIKEVRNQHRGSIERIKNALQFQGGKRTAENFGLRSGDLDEGSLHKLGYDCDNIWSQKTISKLPDVAVGILVDQSGSMTGEKIERARTMCIILAEAIKRVAGVRLYVYGHTANIEGSDLTIYEHYTPSNSDITNLGGIKAHSNNYDGYAIKEVAKRLALDPAKKKYLFVIADGLPSGHGYGGETAEKHVTSVCKFIRDRLKVGVNAFAVGVPEYQHSAFNKQYGDDHVVFIKDIMKCLPQIVRFLRNTLQKERKLVGLED
jgi:von Willebrand factor type A domain